MKIKKSIVLETMNKYVDIILDKLLKECSCNECDCKDEKETKKLKLLIDDEDEKHKSEEDEKDEDLEDIDEQSNLVAAARNPKIVALARKIMKDWGGKLDFKSALIRAERYYGRTGAMI